MAVLLTYAPGRPAWYRTPLSGVGADLGLTSWPAVAQRAPLQHLHYYLLTYLLLLLLLLLHLASGLRGP